MTAYAWTPWETHTAEKNGYWDSQSFDAGTTHTTQDQSTLACWDVTFRYKRTVPTGIREDYATFGLRIAKQVSGFQVGIGLLSELTAIETMLSTLATAVSVYQASQFTLDQFIWHERRANHPVAEGGGEKPGPAIKYTAKNQSGQITVNRAPDQLAVTVTFKTCSRRHWGRVYLPGIAIGNFDTQYGRISNGVCDGLALAFRTLQNSLDAAGYDLIIWSYPKQAALGITQIACDDVPDIQRRRRPKQRNYVKTYTS